VGHRKDWSALIAGANCSGKDGELTPEFRQPFDTIALEAVACAREKAAGTFSDDLLSLRVGEGT
jgi:hypothetical protein